MGEAGNIIPADDLDADDIKAWIHHVFVWTPSDLEKLFRTVIGKVCYESCLANDYADVLAAFERVNVRWKGASAELVFLYYKPHGNGMYDNKGQLKQFSDRVENILTQATPIFRMRHNLRVRHEERINWRNYGTEPWGQDICKVLRIFATNSKWTAKEIKTENIKYRKGAEEKTNVYIASW